MQLSHSAKMKSFLDTYTTYESVPTRQDISNLDAHLRRRDALYRTLGIVPAHLEGKQLLEFGPGSGENSIFLASLKPSRYTLVDGTESSIRSLQEIRAKYYPHINAEMVHAEFLQFQSVEKYDAVFCEGAIPTQADPIPLLQHIASFVKPGGVLVITTVDAVSFLSEAIRRFLARIYIGSPQLDISHVPKLVEFFKNDLDTLKGMSRKREDWVIDQIIHPWNGPPFSMADAIATLGSNFSAHGTSPRFFSDWRWYKSIHQEDDGFSTALLASYHSEVHNFLDWRFSLPAADMDSNNNLLALSRQVYDLEFAMETGKKPFDSTPMVSLLKKIWDECTQLHEDTRLSLAKAIQAISRKSNVEQCDLSSWWGRGQQYLSLVRKA
jgi:ubiquinone/menaquinone biosynthesis C-methylase UbiE